MRNQKTLSNVEIKALYRVLAAFVSPLLLAQNSLLAEQKELPGTKTLAVVQGIAITESQLQKAAEAELEKLELQQLQMQAQHERNKHQVLELSLNRLIEEKLLDAEAAQRGTTRVRLLAAQVESKVQDPSEAEIATFYESNKSQIGKPKEQVAGAIRDYLKENRRKQIHGSYIEGLRIKYDVKSFLKPLRTAVETANHPSRGSADAPITIAEFSDFECPYCSRLAVTLKQVEKTYGDKLRLVFLQFPLTIHPRAQKAAEASLCAHENGRFWEMYDLLFQEPRTLAIEDLKAKAAKLGLDTAAFNNCLESGRHAERVRQDIREGSRVGVTGTPAIFINGRFVSGAVPYEEIAKVINEELQDTKKMKTLLSTQSSANKAH